MISNVVAAINGLNFLCSGFWAELSSYKLYYFFNITLSDANFQSNQAMEAAFFCYLSEVEMLGVKNSSLVEAADHFQDADLLFH
jgi:hypothetical protein